MLTTKLYLFGWEGSQVNHDQTIKLRETTMATSRLELKTFCSQNSITITKIRKTRKVFYLSPLHLKAKLAIVEQLLQLLTTGFPLLESFSLIRCQTQTMFATYLINKVKHHILHGNSLTVSLRLVAIFEPLCINIIDAGEQSGQLEMALSQVATLYKKQLDYAHKLKKMLFYPATVTVFTLLLFIITCVYVIPQFSSMYQQMNATLPWITQALICLSTAFTKHLSMIIFLPISAFLLIKQFAKRSRLLSARLTIISLSLPLIGPLIKINTLSHMFLTLSSTLEAGIPLIKALTLSINTCQNLSIKNQLLPIIDSLSQGLPLVDAMTKTNCFDQTALHLIRLGDLSGQLTEMLNHLTQSYENKMNNILNRMQTLIEPLIMVLLGGLVGGVVLAMYLPIIQLMNHF